MKPLYFGTLFLAFIVLSVVLVHSVDAKNKDSKAKSAIIKAIGKAVEGKYSTIKLIQLSKSNVSGYIIAYNTTKPTPIPPLPPVPPTPQPSPTPTSPTTKVCLVGDLKGSTVPNMMSGFNSTTMKKDCDVKIGLGDLGYASDLSWFKSLNFNKCVIGNHDATEDGNSAIYQEALAYCGDHWSLKIGTSALILGFNTNADPSEQITAAKAILTNSGSMANVKTVVLVSHKGGHVPPNSHHPAEAANLYASLEKLVPSGVRLVEVFGHNHVSSSAPSKNWYQAGAGGKSFYSCGTDAIWTYCDNKKVGYLELTISNTDGATAAKFVN